MRRTNYSIFDYEDGDYQPEPVKVKVPNGCVKTTEPKPPTYSYHYNNPESQGALMAETDNFPGYYNPKKESIHTAYSDRLASWDYNNFKKLCAFAGTGDQGWHVLQSFSDDRLKEFAQIAFKLDKLPKHVQIIHYYNVSNGYSCPVVVAITDKGK